MALERVNYYTGQRLDADDLRTEQGYQATVRRLLNEGLFTAGVLQGLEVEQATENGLPAPRTILVRSGTALDSLGRLIVLDGDVRIAVPNLLPTGGTDGYYLVLRYHEEPVATDEAGRVGAAPVGRVREEPLLDWSEVIPLPRPGDPADSIEYGVVISLVRLDPDAKIAGIDADARRLSFPRNVSRVQAVAYEGEKDLAPGNPKKLYFHIRGGRPSKVVLYLRGDAFSPTAYTEIAAHGHTLSGVSVGGTGVTTQDHRHSTAHAHQLLHGDPANPTPGMADAGNHGHRLYTRARVDKARPQHAVSTDDYGGASTDYFFKGWRGNIGQNTTEFDEDYIEGAGTHAHAAAISGPDPAMSGTMVDPPAVVGHNHTFAATVDPAGSTGPALRGGAAHTYPANVLVHFGVDRKPITQLLINRLGGDWTALGGAREDSFNTDGTGPIDLVQLGLSIGPGENVLEFSVEPPDGGKIIYQLYIE